MNTYDDGRRGGDGGPVRRFWNGPVGLAVSVLLAIVGVWLWIEHRAHILAALPLLLPLAACLLMHLFMHRGHGGHDER